MKIETISVAEATERLRALGVKISSPTLRAGLQQGVYPFGVCIQPEDEDGHPVYQIFVRLLDQWIEERAS